MSNVKKQVEALFSARYNQLWQIVLSKKGVVGGHGSVR